MYSILINKGTNLFAYALDEVSGEPFAETLVETKAKFNELLQKNPISRLVVIHNTTVNTDLSITDVE